MYIFQIVHLKLALTQKNTSWTRHESPQNWWPPLQSLDRHFFQLFSLSQETLKILASSSQEKIIFTIEISYLTTYVSIRTTNEELMKRRI